MPKKSKRVASRQAQISGRAKRERPHGPAGVPATRPAPQTSGPDGDKRAPIEKRPYSLAAVQEAPSTESQRFTPASSARLRSRTPQLPPVETYFVPELRRIAIAMAVVLAILVVLMFVLR